MGRCLDWTWLRAQKLTRKVKKRGTMLTTMRSVAARRYQPTEVALRRVMMTPDIAGKESLVNGKPEPGLPLYESEMSLLGLVIKWW